MTILKQSDEIRAKIKEVNTQALEKHGEIFAEINQELSQQLQEIESA
jgi:nicotinamide mononucleotide (NMN) deamidase PncC